ncbi:MAG: potassium transporter TrkG, partial [Verrucomicrobiota bacterium]
IKSAHREILRLIQPRAVLHIKLNHTPLDTERVRSIKAFFIMFCLILSTATFMMSFYLSDFDTALSAVLASLGNIGPGLGEVGPMANYAHLPWEGKIILTGCMLLGRLELYTVLVMMTPGFWKR